MYGVSKDKKKGFSFMFCAFWNNCGTLLSVNRTVEEFKKGHVGSDKILNIPYMFNTPEGNLNL
jgi:hypothetical protein